MKKYQNFLSENFHFLVVKFSVYLIRHVFLMIFKNHLNEAIQTNIQKHVFLEVLNTIFLHNFCHLLSEGFVPVELTQ